MDRTESGESPLTEQPSHSEFSLKELQDIGEILRHGAAMRDPEYHAYDDALIDRLFSRLLRWWDVNDLERSVSSDEEAAYQRLCYFITLTQDKVNQSKEQDPFLFKIGNDLLQRRRRLVAKADEASARCATEEDKRQVLCFFWLNSPLNKAAFCVPEW